MPNSLVLGTRPISIEDVEEVARREVRVEFAESAQARIGQGRVKLEERLAAGERIYGVNTGVGGNIKFALDAEQTERFQHNLMNHLSCGTGAPLAARRGARRHAAPAGHVLARVVGSALGTGFGVGEFAQSRHRAGGAALRIGGRERRSDAFCLHRAQRCSGMGEVDYQGRRMPAAEALQLGRLAIIHFAPRKDWR